MFKSIFDEPIVSKNQGFGTINIFPTKPWNIADFILVMQQYSGFYIVSTKENKVSENKFIRRR